MPGTAAFISPGRSLEEAARRAGVAESFGYDLVLDNHIANRDGLLSLVAYAQHTDTVALGTGVYPALLQSTLSLGQQAATLDELVGGRLVLGIGTSHREVIEYWHGLEFPDDPVAVMRQKVNDLRQLFADRSLGAFQFLRFEPREDIPIHLSALSPKMLQLAGEVADGVVLWLCDPPYVRDVVVPNVHEGAERAGRDPDSIEIIAAVTVALADPPDPAIDRFRNTLFAYLGLPFYRRMLERSGWGDDLARFDRGEQVSDRMLRSLAGIGSADDVAAKVEEYRDAGVTMPGVGALTTTGTASFEETLEAVHR